jgi:hypothetical protein
MKYMVGWAAFFLICVVMLAPTAAMAGLQGENLLVAPLAGWVKVYSGAGHGITMVGYVPPGQNANAWSQLAIVQVFDGKGGTSPALIQQRVIDGLRLNCDSMHVTDLGAGTTSGLPAKRWVTYCGRVKELNLGEITSFQAISGKDHFFLVQRSWRGAPFDLAKPLPIPDTLLKEWEAYLNLISVCDSRDPKRPCP